MKLMSWVSEKQLAMLNYNSLRPYNLRPIDYTLTVSEDIRIRWDNFSKSEYKVVGRRLGLTRYYVDNFVS